MSNKLIIGSRDSKLALIQSNWVKDRLMEAHPGLEVEIVEIKTQGDKILDVALSKIGDKGLFTKELEYELLEANIDLAVHSMKDLPTQLPEGLEIAATTTREDPRDVVVFSKRSIERSYKDLNDCAVIASSSLRRQAQIRKLYPDLRLEEIRGNLQTRFSKLDHDDYALDAMVLAAAGLHRLDMQDRISFYLDPKEVLPAVGQGALGIEVRSDRDDVKKLLQPINSEQDELMIKGERAFLRCLEGGCQVPIGAYSEYFSGKYQLTGAVFTLNGEVQIKDRVEGKLEDAEKLGYELGYALQQLGAGEILSAIRA